MTWDYEQYMRNKQQRIAKTGESCQEHSIFCPYCGHQQSEYWDYKEDQEQDQDCEECDKTFAVRCNTVYSTRILK